MWRSYLTVGIRSLAKSRVYAFINIVGLGVGLAACLLLLLYVRYERSYDDWLPNADNVYQVQGEFRDLGTGQEMLMQVTAYVVGTTLKQDFPEIEDRVYVGPSAPVILRDGDAITAEHFAFVDGNLFDLMEVQFLRGDRATALDEVGNIVLTESEARRFFGDADPIGQTLTLALRTGQVEHRVTGVIPDWPRNSHLRLKMIARYDPQSFFAEAPQFLTGWGQNQGYNYVRLRDGTDPASLEARFDAWEKRHIPDQELNGQTLNQGEIADWKLVNVRDVHLGPRQIGFDTPGNDEQTILTFTIVAFLILGMACINFTNLATARASSRAREVALRKVLGANRRQLIIQFLLESFIVAAIAMLLALALAELLLPVIGNFLDADLSMSYFGEGGMFLPILLLTMIVGAAGGIYPAFYLSRFQPAQVLKANKSTAEAAGSGLLRSVLVVSQFAVSIGLIICTAVVYAQTVHARTADPGYNREGLIQIEGLNRRQLQGRGEALAREIERVPGVVSAALTSIGVATLGQSQTVMQVPGRQIPVGMGVYIIDDQFLRTMGIELLAGRGVSRDRPMDVDPTPVNPSAEQQRAFAERGANILINEKGARDLGFVNPADAVGKQYRMALVEPENGSVPVTIVGVVRDSRFRSIREPIEPLTFLLSDAGHSYLVVRYDDPDPAAVRERIEQAWHRIAPDVPFEADFSEDVVAELYNAESARATIFAGFAVLAVVIACLGLFGLAAYTAERRTKEIGIRKVLGARTGDIVRLLAWQFSKPVILANLIAWPVAWGAMLNWMERFDASTRVDIGVFPFLAAGALALTIALGTIASHAFRVARANPIHALRYE